jgi:hypothetical protein
MVIGVGLHPTGTIAVFVAVGVFVRVLVRVAVGGVPVTVDVGVPCTRGILSKYTSCWALLLMRVRPSVHV